MLIEFPIVTIAYLIFLLPILLRPPSGVNFEWLLESQVIYITCRIPKTTLLAILYLLAILGRILTRRSWGAYSACMVFYGSFQTILYQTFTHILSIVQFLRFTVLLPVQATWLQADEDYKTGKTYCLLHWVWSKILFVNWLMSLFLVIPFAASLSILLDYAHWCSVVSCRIWIVPPMYTTACRVPLYPVLVLLACVFNILSLMLFHDSIFYVFLTHSSPQVYFNFDA